MPMSIWQTWAFLISDRLLTDKGSLEVQDTIYDLSVTAGSMARQVI